LNEWLDEVCRLFEAVFPGTLCSVYLKDGDRLVAKAGPSLPEEYFRRVAQVPIGPRAGSCGTAAFRNETVVVEDITTNPLWQEFSHLALPYGLRACWSVPLRDSSSRVVGTFAVYSRQVRPPQDSELAFLEKWAQLVSMALQWRNQREVLERSRESFRKLIDASPEAIVLLCPYSGKFLRVNPAAERLYGLSAGELLQRTLANLSPPQQPDGRDSETLIAKFLSAAVAGEQPVFEWTHLDAQGNPFTAEVRLLVLEWEDRTVVRAVVLDISERKELESQLQRELAFIQALMDSVPANIFLFDTEQRLLRWNREVEHKSGYSAEEIRKKPALEFLAPEDRERAAEAIMQTFLTGAGSVEARLLTKHGELIPYLYRGVRVDTPSGPLLLGIGVDLTERKKMETLLQEAEKMNTLGKLSAGIAHDFNNLLTVILGYTDMMLHGADSGHCDAKAICESASNIREAAERAKSLVAQLLAFSCQALVAPRRLDLNVLVQQQLPLVQRLLGGRVTVQLRLSPRPAIVTIDAEQFSRLLLNLTSNAADAMPEGGTFSIAVQHVKIESSSPELPLPAGHYVHLTISDTGCGMTPDVLSRAFDPFFTTKQPGRGTGLGLSVVYGIVRQHGGHVRIESEVNKGTRVHIYWPAAEVPQAASVAAAEPTAAAKTKVLVVDDEPVVLKFVAKVLEMRGLSVVCASCADEALKLIASGLDVPLMITDVVMPGKNGYQLAAEVTRLKPDMQVLFISGYTADKDFRRGLMNDELNFLAKPFTPAALWEKVEPLLSTGAGGRCS